MKGLRMVVLGLIVLAIVYTAHSQDLSQRETDPIIIEKLEEWQDLKFGFMMHWGPYSQWGVVESWSICNEDWIDRKGANYVDYMRDYWKLNTSFNPVNFNPEAWASLAKDAGMKYLVFTTKHHDGFSMFDTKQTNYSITDPSCPFSKNPRADITGEIVNSFRDKGFWIGLYFSKPDWNHSDYWAPEWATPDRNVNYDINRYPERWKRFCEFTYNQIKELTTQYGSIDILWLDGGWVRPEYSLNDEYREWLGCYQRVQDIDMPKIANMARRNNPSLLIVDRTVHGKYENYETPEKQVPDEALERPWETCMTMGDSWSYVPNDNYKSTNTIIHLLVDIVSKGGNLLLNVGPDSEGNLPDKAIERMKEIGAWMDINGEAIYSTRAIKPYKEGDVCFTQKDGTVYAILLLDEGEEIPEEIILKELSIEPKTGRKKILGTNTKANLRKTKDNNYSIRLPKALNKDNSLKHGIVIQL